jgi:hypothetical protein
MNFPMQQSHSTYIYLSKEIPNENYRKKILFSDSKFNYTGKY